MRTRTDPSICTRNYNFSFCEWPERLERPEYGANGPRVHIRGITFVVVENCAPLKWDFPIPRCVAQASGTLIPDIDLNCSHFCKHHFLFTFYLLCSSSCRSWFGVLFIDVLSLRILPLPNCFYYRVNARARSVRRILAMPISDVTVLTEPKRISQSMRARISE